MLLFRVHCLDYTRFLVASFASNPGFSSGTSKSRTPMGKGVPTLGVRGETPDVMALFC